jgi:hypothetical protein
MSSEMGAAMPAQDTTEQAADRRGPIAWLKRLGLAGFLFFFIKGLLWLFVPAAIVWWQGMSGGE